MERTYKGCYRDHLKVNSWVTTGEGVGVTGDKSLEEGESHTENFEKQSADMRPRC